MTLLDEHRLADGRKEADALIEEARQRQRRRRLLVGSIVLVVALASGIWAAVDIEEAGAHEDTGEHARIGQEGHDNQRHLAFRAVGARHSIYDRQHGLRVGGIGLRNTPLLCRHRGHG